MNRALTLPGALDEDGGPVKLTILADDGRMVTRGTYGPGWIKREDRVLEQANITLIGVTYQEFVELYELTRWEWNGHYVAALEMVINRLRCDREGLPRLGRPGVQHCVIGGWMDHNRTIVTYTFLEGSRADYRHLLEIVRGEWDPGLTRGLETIVTRQDYDVAMRSAGRW